MVRDSSIRSWFERHSPNLNFTPAIGVLHKKCRTHFVFGSAKADRENNFVCSLRRSQRLFTPPRGQFQISQKSHSAIDSLCGVSMSARTTEMERRTSQSRVPGTNHVTKTHVTRMTLMRRSQSLMPQLNLRMRRRQVRHTQRTPPRKVSFNLADSAWATHEWTCNERHSVPHKKLSEYTGFFPFR